MGPIYHGVLKRELRHFARDFLTKNEATLAISGMAIGWDQALALAAIDLKIPFYAVMPFPGMEKKWQPDMQAEFHWIRERAEDQITVAPEFSLAAYQARNERMVDLSEAVLALWDGRKHGGTHNCLLYAHKRGRRVHHLWQDWQDRAKDTLRAGWQS